VFSPIGHGIDFVNSRGDFGMDLFDQIFVLEVQLFLVFVVGLTGRKESNVLIPSGHGRCHLSGDHFGETEAGI